jgi:hypothetical protein
MAQERAFARPGLPKDRHVHCATGISERLVSSSRVTVHNPESEIESTHLAPCSASPALEAVPESNKKLFEELFHDVLQCGGTRDKNGNNVRAMGAKEHEERGVAGLLA